MRRELSDGHVTRFIFKSFRDLSIFFFLTRTPTSLHVHIRARKTRIEYVLLAVHRFYNNFSRSGGSNV